MTKPKKMSLGEFMADDSLGTSWADEDFDINSIELPMSRPAPRGYQGRMDNNDRYGGGGDDWGGGGRPDYGYRGGGGGGRDYGPPQPRIQAPYIAKLTNLPEISTEKLIQDLLDSRFMHCKSVKVLVDPNPPQPRFMPISSDKTKKKKCAFVQLNTADDMRNMLKWRDIYIKRLRVNVDVADFDDFKEIQKYNESIGYNKDGEEDKKNNEKLAEEAKRAANWRQNVETPDRYDRRGPLPPSQPEPIKPMKPVRILQPKRHIEKPKPVVPKVNPFGSAKPVDPKKQLEIEQEISKMSLNSTTFSTKKAKHVSKKKAAAHASRGSKPSTIVDRQKVVQNKTKGEKSEGKGNQAAKPQIKTKKASKADVKPKEMASEKIPKIAANPAVTERERSPRRRQRRRSRGGREHRKTDEIERPEKPTRRRRGSGSDRIHRGSLPNGRGHRRSSSRHRGRGRRGRGKLNVEAATKTDSSIKPKEIPRGPKTRKDKDLSKKDSANVSKKPSIPTGPASSRHRRGGRRGGAGRRRGRPVSGNSSKAKEAASQSKTTSQSKASSQSKVISQPKATSQSKASSESKDPSKSKAASLPKVTSEPKVTSKPETTSPSKAAGQPKIAAQPKAAAEPPKAAPIKSEHIPKDEAVNSKPVSKD